ncbi:putative isoamylase [Chloropicon primus]|uniref:Putative isoamylase n=1 Tax=Chloropicon primus TaxID=1764295 RepID=A0A5B8MMN1_9CHLO|nr:putative isoamylase [Chloropicon primus]UPR01138.1 putative isoamylase [Chloropicon primus]|eukprot:QDZ21918.1 putative isoamylase [Chloropicon primus]
MRLPGFTAGRRATASAVERRHAYQLVGSRNEVVRVCVEETQASMAVTVRLRKSNSSGEMSLRWWILGGASGEVEVSQGMTGACEATKLAGNALVTPFSLEGGEFVVTLVLPRSEEPFSRFGFNPTYVHSGRPVLSRPRDHSFFGVPLGFYPGTPFPLGAHRVEGDWFNFTLLSDGPVAPKLHLFETTSGGKGEPCAYELELDPTVNRTGGVWHCALRVPGGVDAYALSLPETHPVHGYKVDEEMVADPFGDDVAHTKVPSGGEKICTVSLLPRGEGQGEDIEEEWEEDGPLHHTLSKTVVLEMDLRREDGDQDGDGGVFEAVETAAVGLEDSGVTALAVRGLLSEETLTSVTSVANGLGSSAMKRLVASLHRMDLELFVQLDCLKLQSVAKAPHLNEGKAIQSLKESLRFLVTEYHLDGIFFLHAEKLTHGDSGVVLDRPPIVEDLCNDPVLQSTKMVAVPFGSHLLPREGVRGFPHWGRWAEMNSRFVTDMQDLFLQDDRSKVDLTKVSMRLTGSADLFQRWENGSYHLFAERPPCYGLNSVSSMDGLPFSQQVEQGSKKAKFSDSIRWALITAAFASQGVPLIRLLDLSNENWAEELAVFSKLASFRECYSDLIQQPSFDAPRDLRWHGVDALAEPKWEMPPPAPLELPVGSPLEEPLACQVGELRYIGMSFWSESKLDAVYAGFNGNDTDVLVTLPEPQLGHRWVVVLDSGRLELSLTNESTAASPEYLMKPKSSILLVMQRP